MEINKNLIQEYSQYPKAKSSNLNISLFNKIAMSYNMHVADKMGKNHEFQKAAEYYEKAANNASKSNMLLLNKNLMLLSMDNYSKAAMANENMAEMRDQDSNSVSFYNNKANHYKIASNQRKMAANIANKIGLDSIFAKEIENALNDSKTAYFNFKKADNFGKTYEMALDIVLISKNLNISTESAIKLKDEALSSYEKHTLSMLWRK
jgi:tetratricopeptide (TPR) repeat protein